MKIICLGDSITGQADLSKYLKFSNVLDEKPQVVVLLIGGNDKKETDADKAVTRSNIDAILSALEAAGAKVLVLQYHCLVNAENEKTAWVWLDDNNDLIAEVAGKHKAPVLDMSAQMKAALATQPLPELASPTDGVHLGPGGELVYARAIFSKLLELKWVK